MTTTTTTKTASQYKIQNGYKITKEKGWIDRPHEGIMLRAQEW